MYKVKEIIIQLKQYSSEALLSIEQKRLLQAAQAASAGAYAPYSQFFVGAAILLENGEIVQGANQENAAYPSGLCAERTAIFYTGARYPEQRIKMIAIAARPAKQNTFISISPCGACRQAMLEYEVKQGRAIPILMQGENECIYEFASIAALLPFCFDKSSL